MNSEWLQDRVRPLVAQSPHSEEGFFASLRPPEIQSKLYGFPAFNKTSAGTFPTNESVPTSL
jgi:hypothetical protein